MKEEDKRGVDRGEEGREKRGKEERIAERRREKRSIGERIEEMIKERS